MNREDLLRMARDRFGGYADQAASLFEQFANDIRSATKEEDARICDDLEMRNTRAGPADCGAAIRASK